MLPYFGNMPALLLAGVLASCVALSGCSSESYSVLRFTAPRIRVSIYEETDCVRDTLKLNGLSWSSEEERRRYGDFSFDGTGSLRVTAGSRVMNIQVDETCVKILDTTVHSHS